MGISPQQNKRDDEEPGGAGGLIDRLVSRETHRLAVLSISGAREGKEDGELCGGGVDGSLLARGRNFSHSKPCKSGND